MNGLFLPSEFQMRLCYLLIFAVFSAFGQGNKPSGRGMNSQEHILFTAGNQQIAASEFEYLFRKNHKNNPEAFNKKGVEEYLNLYINFKLKVSEAYARGLDTTAAFKTEFQGYKNELLKSYLTRRSDNEKLAEEAYERMKEEVRASHLLLTLDEGALPADTLRVWNQVIDIRKKFLAGEDFASLVKTYSSDPGAAQSGGDLGYFSALDMVYPFESVAYNTPVGSVSMPVRTRYGYHLIRVTDRRPAGNKVEVSHIMVRARDENGLQRIREAKAKLAAGEKWADIFKNYSEDQSAPDQLGRLQPFRRGGFDPAAPEFENAAFSLRNTGELSEPVLTAFGWHLIRLEKIISLPEYSAYASELQKRISMDERSYLSAVKQLERQKKAFGYTENQGVIAKMLSLSDSTLFEGKWQFFADPDFRSKTLFTIDNAPVPVWAFVNFIGEVQQPVPPSAINEITPSELMRQMMDGFISLKAMDAEEKKLERENESYRMLLREYREGILLFSIMESEVWKKASADTAGQRLYYNANSFKYRAGERIRARLLSVADSLTAESFLERHNRGDSITSTDLRKFRTVTPFRNYEKGENKIIDKVVWMPGLYRTEDRSVIWLVEIKRLIPPGLKTLQEARASVISDYQDEVEKKWLLELRKQFPVSVDEKAKKMIFKRLSAPEGSGKQNRKL